MNEFEQDLILKGYRPIDSYINYGDDYYEVDNNGTTLDTIRESKESLSKEFPNFDFMLIEDDEGACLWADKNYLIYKEIKDCEYIIEFNKKAIESKNHDIMVHQEMIKRYTDKIEKLKNGWYNN